MPGQRNLIKMIILFLLFVVVMAGCALVTPGITNGTPTAETLRPTPTPTLAPTPTPAPVPMVRITVQLTDVYCDHKQNAFGTPDQFYMMTTFAAPSPGSNPKARPDTQALLSKPVTINSGQQEELKGPYVLVFDGLVPPNGSIRGGFIAYNDQKGLTWQDINYWTAKIAKEVGDKLLDKSYDSDNLYLIGAAAVADLAVNIWDALSSQTKDGPYKLGETDGIITASGPPAQGGVLHFSNPGGLFGVGGWDYTVHYLITRTTVMVTP